MMKSHRANPSARGPQDTTAGVGRGKSAMFTMPTQTNKAKVAGSRLAPVPNDGIAVTRAPKSSLLR